MFRPCDLPLLFLGGFLIPCVVLGLGVVAVSSDIEFATILDNVPIPAIKSPVVCDMLSLRPIWLFAISCTDRVEKILCLFSGNLDFVSHCSHFSAILDCYDK